MSVVSGGCIYYLQQEKKEMKENLKRIEASRQDVQYGRPQIGGPFQLIDCETNKTVTEEDFKGKFMVMYFGFTHCMVELKLYYIALMKKDLYLNS